MGSSLMESALVEAATCSIQVGSAANCDDIHSLFRHIPSLYRRYAI